MAQIKDMSLPQYPTGRARLDLPFPITHSAPTPCTLLSEDQPHLPCSPQLEAPNPHLWSWPIREMEARRLAVAAAGPGAVGLRSRGGRKGCTKRLARKASGWEQGKTGQKRGQKWEEVSAGPKSSE